MSVFKNAAKSNLNLGSDSADKYGLLFIFEYAFDLLIIEQPEYIIQNLNLLPHL